MRVLVDATAIPVHRGGVGRYVDELTRALAAAGIDVVVACRPSDESAFAAAVERAVPVAAARWRGSRLLWEQFRLPRLVRTVRPDVLHCPHYTIPRSPGVPVVVTIHDATFFTRPDLHTWVKGPFFRRATRIALHRAARCVVPSSATAHALVQRVGADERKLTVAHLGADLSFFTAPAPEDVAKLRTAYDLGDGPFVAFLGTLEPRKNVPALIEGFVAAFRDDEQAPTLVLAGGSGWDHSIASAVEAARKHVRVVSTAYLPLEQVPALLGGAAVVVYPSLDEGFGLPVLEAMACGAAVLTTRRGSLPEVGGDAVAYTEPDAASIGAALRSLVADPDRRAELSAAGPQRARGFTWAASANAHIEAFEAAIGSDR
ncbi:MAG: hypothetical protein QOH79_2905 [Acidimicrobiaceae bacterium]|jgi:glycosyltransferase involved in cell wall biosynthesis